MSRPTRTSSRHLRLSLAVALLGACRAAVIARACRPDDTADRPGSARGS